MDAVPASGENFVRIGLVADIPDQFIVWRVEDSMNGDSEFDNAEARAEMAAGFGDGVDRFGAEVIGQNFKLGIGQGFHVGRDMHPVEDGLRSCGWFFLCLHAVTLFFRVCLFSR